ncbi:carbohydrate ABC transporter permease [Bacillus sp. AK128]
MDKLSKISMYVLAIIWVIPLVWVVYTSFRPKDQILSGNFWGTTFTLENYINAWNKAPFTQYYVNTLLIVFGILIVQLITTTLAAYAFARLNFKLKNFIFILFLVQIMIPAEALIFPNYKIVAGMGLIDQKLSIMIPYFTSAFGIFLLRQTFKQVPAELEEAARLDGCNLFQILWHVYVPLARPTFIAFGLVSVSHHWNNFLWPLIVTNSIESRPISVGLALFASSFETGTQFAETTAATMLVITPLLLAFLLFQRQFLNSFMQSGMK